MQQMRKSVIGCLLVLLSLGAAVNLEAKVWKVYPTMTRAAIQAVIDLAKDNDTIRFKAGTYVFSDTPFSTKAFAGGALFITDKSLKFVADNGTTLVGADSDLDSDGVGTSGIIAFIVMNSVTKDISFKGFIFQKFLMAIASGIEISYDPVTGDVMAPSCRDFTVQNCTFQDIDRNAVALTGVQRNIKILNNEITWSRRIGIFIDWYWVGVDHLGIQPKSGKITMTNNEINARQIGVTICRGNKMSIENNTFDATGSDWDSEGLEISGGATSASIVKNYFSNLTYGLFLSGDKITASVAFPMTKCNVTNNLIFADDGGILLEGSACYANKFTNNKIAVDGPLAWAISVWGSNHDTFINNKILGSGNVAIAVQGFDDTASGGFAALSNNELFNKNSVKNFIVFSSGVDYYMSAMSHDNTAIGICPEKATYYDEGVNNIFKCIFKNGTTTTTAASKNGFALAKPIHFDRNPFER
jgi:hypothetical protein